METTTTISEVRNESALRQEQTKQCKKCGRTLPLNEYHRMENSIDGHSSTCKRCSNAYQKERRQARKQECEPDGGTYPELAAFIPRQLINELRGRGYRGTLTYQYEIKL